MEIKKRQASCFFSAALLLCLISAAVASAARSKEEADSDTGTTTVVEALGMTQEGGGEVSAAPAVHNENEEVAGGAEEVNDSQGAERKFAGDDCSVKTTIGAVKHLGDGLWGGRLSLQNTGQKEVNEVLVLLSADKTLYCGIGQKRLSLFPLGEADFYFTGADGDILLPAGGVKTFPIFWKGANAPTIKQSICSGEGLLEKIFERIEGEQRFGKYTPYAKSSIRSLYSSEGGWRDILSTSQGEPVEGGGRAYFFASVADNCLSTIAQGIIMMGSGDGGVSDYQRDSMIESYFKDAQNEFESGNFDNAVELLAKVLTLQPDNAMGLNNTAYIMLKRGDKPSAARAFAEQALALKPNEPGFQNTMSIVLWGEGEKEKAISLATKAHLGSGGAVTEARDNLIKWTGRAPDVASKEPVSDREVGSEEGDKKREAGGPETPKPESEDGEVGGDGVTTSDTLL
jgi:tetratricopeptide (TPR) repeat protein